MSTQIRLPEDLHARLSELARRQYRSLNSLMVHLLAQGAEREMERETGPPGETGREREAPHSESGER